MKKSAWFSFKNKDSPDYVSSYGDTYTDRQLAILNNEIPLYEIRPNELSILYKKAKQKLTKCTFMEFSHFYNANFHRCVTAHP